MVDSKRSSLPNRWAAAAILAAVVGCGGGSDPTDLVATANRDNLRRLTSLYSAFHAGNALRGPADESEFKSFVKGVKPSRLARIGIDAATIDELFFSERDGEPFRVRYGVPGNVMGSDDPVVFENTGVDGTRMVGFLNMEQREVDEAEYERLWSGNSAPGRAVRNTSG